jgi:methionine-rich copper-binding protein CopC
MRSDRTITLAASLALWATHASAHASLESATPAVGSTVSPAPRYGGPRPTCRQANRS